MTIYTNSSMVPKKHVIEIDKQLQQFGSKVDKNLLEAESTHHILANVLFLACGEGAYSISIDQINSIKHSEFEIACDCRNATIKKPK